MDFAMTPLAPRPAPEHRPDLRPAADAAGTQRLTRTALPPAAAAPPPSPLQAALVGRALLEARAPGAADPVERVLKPFGVGMLPHRDPGEPAAATASDGRASSDPVARPHGEG